MWFWFYICFPESLLKLLLDFSKFAEFSSSPPPTDKKGIALQPALYVNTRTDVGLKITVHMNVMPLLAAVSYRRFGGKHAATTFGIERNRIITTYHNTLRHILQDHSLRCHHYKNLESV